MPPFNTYNGTIQFQQFFALFIQPGNAPLTLIAYSATGDYSPAAAAVSAHYFATTLNKVDGDPLQVTGGVGQVNGQQAMLWVSAV